VVVHCKEVGNVNACCKVSKKAMQVVSKEFTFRDLLIFGFLNDDSVTPKVGWS